MSCMCTIQPAHPSAFCSCIHSSGREWLFLLLQDAVAVVGYPIGGDTISVTSGVVSRIEVTSYVHGSTELLGVQIDAAINSGNSGMQLPAVINASSVYWLSSMTCCSHSACFSHGPIFSQHAPAVMCKLLAF